MPKFSSEEAYCYARDRLINDRVALADSFRELGERYGVAPKRVEGSYYFARKKHPEDVAVITEAMQARLAVAATAELSSAENDYDGETIYEDVRSLIKHHQAKSVQQALHIIEEKKGLNFSKVQYHYYAYRKQLEKQSILKAVNTETVTKDGHKFTLYDPESKPKIPEMGVGQVVASDTGSLVAKPVEYGTDITPVTTPVVVAESVPIEKKNDTFISTLLDMMIAAESADMDIERLFTGLMPMMKIAGDVKTLKLQLAEKDAKIAELEEKLATQPDLSAANFELTKRNNALQTEVAQLKEKNETLSAQENELFDYLRSYVSKNGYTRVRECDEFTSRVKVYLDGHTGLVLTETDRAEQN